MAETASSVLTAWSNFYVMTGSSAAALTGLMFVVITLVSEARLRRNPDGISTFSTPTVTHFGAVLFVSAILCAPWRSPAHPAPLLGLGALCGIVYLARVMHLTRRLRSYSADLEDWTWYTILPLLAYVVILAGAILLFVIPASALFAVAGGVVILIFIGIRNAWDVVTFIIATGRDDEPPSPS